MNTKLFKLALSTMTLGLVGCAGFIEFRNDNVNIDETWQSTYAALQVSPIDAEAMAKGLKIEISKTKISITPSLNYINGTCTGNTVNVTNLKSTDEGVTFSYDSKDWIITSTLTLPDGSSFPARIKKEGEPSSDSDTSTSSDSSQASSETTTETPIVYKERLVMKTLSQNKSLNKGRILKEGDDSSQSGDTTSSDDTTSVTSDSGSSDSGSSSTPTVETPATYYALTLWAKKNYPSAS